MTSLRTIAAASFFALASFAVAPVAFAGDPVIDAAIEAGQVGETIDGLLGVVARPIRQSFARSTRSTIAARQSMPKWPRRPARRCPGCAPDR